MCRFRIKVMLCGCRDYDCRQINPTLNEDNPSNHWDSGHVIKIMSYYRDGPMCMEYFVNRDPERLVVKYGVDPNNTNSVQDCKRRVFRLEMEQVRSATICSACKKTCIQDMEA